MASLSGQVSRLRLHREMAAVSLFVCIAVGSFALLRPTSETGAPSSSLARMFVGGKVEAGWVDEFERFAARSDANMTAVQKVNVPVGSLPADTASQPVPQIAPLPAVALPAAPDDTLLKTGSIRPQRGTPLLPPVPDADAFKVQKGDRLLNQPHPLQGATGDAPLSPHAALAPARQPRLSGPRLAAAAMKPMDLAPRAMPDAVFQGPPLPPADPALDADAPVLGYAAQGVSVETPFRSLFAVSPSDKRSWLEAATEKTVAKKPVKKPIRSATRSRRHHNG